MKGNIDWSLVLSVIAILLSFFSLWLQYKASKREQERDKREQLKDLKITSRFSELLPNPHFLQYIFHVTCHNNGNQKITIARIVLVQRSDGKLIRNLDISHDSPRVIKSGEAQTYEFSFSTPKNHGIEQLISGDIRIRVMDYDGTVFLG